MSRINTGFGFFGGMFLLAIVVVTLVATSAAADRCHEHGEKWIGTTRTGSNLCQRPDGTVTSR